ncbi:MAG: multiheme c-type cytochrome [candidate division KSB1 bacterium]|nr:multiheme c-type cytochrome [candidate division KSB1 bacterium]
MPRKRKRKRTVSSSSAGTRARTHSGRTGWRMVLLALPLLIAVVLVAMNWHLLRQTLLSSGSNNEYLTDILNIKSPFPQLKQKSPPDAITFTDFAGSDACAECHPAEYRAWRKSTHGRAGGRPGEVAIISPFNHSELTYRDATIKPIRKTDSTYIFQMRRPDGSESVFSVAAVVGGGHMFGGGTQSYFARFSDGTLRFLPFDFSKTSNTWFSQTRHRMNWIPVSRELALADLSEWPPNRILGTERNYVNCQNCHGSQIQVRFDPAARRYQTRFRSLTINCESCHGPAKRHIELMRTDSTGREDIGLAALATLDKDASLKVCFQCHAIKDVLDDAYLSGKPLEDYFSLKLPMLAQNPYQPDGRIREFGYQQNHLYSDCYLNGSMTCVDCHDPHSQAYRDIWGAPLKGKFDDGQCTDCHPSKAVDVQKHTHHKPGSQGSRCVACHMPFLQHPGLGVRVRFARSDHTIPIPRPAFDTHLGIEDACSQCHRDRSVEMLQADVQKWYGDLKPHKTIVTALLQTQKSTSRLEVARALLRPNAGHPMAQFAALTEFIKTHLYPDMPALENDIIDRLKATWLRRTYPISRPWP